MSRSLCKRLLVAAIAVAAAVDQASAARNPHGQPGGVDPAESLANVVERNLTLAATERGLHAVRTVAAKGAFLAPLAPHELSHAVQSVMVEPPVGRSFGLRGPGRSQDDAKPPPAVLSFAAGFDAPVLPHQRRPARHHQH